VRRRRRRKRKKSWMYVKIAECVDFVFGSGAVAVASLFDRLRNLT
jgi:hypothetical protein